MVLTDGWAVHCLNNIAEPGSIIGSINGESVTSMEFTFANCNNLVRPPSIPASVKDLDYAFYGCTSLTTVSAIPSNVTDMWYTFDECSSLSGKILIPCPLSNQNYTYTNCPATIQEYHYDGCGHVETLVKVGTTVDTNSTINGEVYSSNNPIIPAGFKAINTDTSAWNAINGPEVSKGLVISDGNSEFVWVPVSQINDMVMCQEHGADVQLNKETLQCPTCKENTKLAGKLYATSTVDRECFSSTTTGQTYTGYREPDTVDSDYEYLSTLLEGEYAKTQTAASFKAQLQNEFNNMAKSVAKYGGFYVGRYETSLTSGKTVQSKYGEESSNASKSDTSMWYGLYTKSKTYVSTKSSVKSSMIWGSQYDAMMRWIANEDDTKVKSTIAGKNTNRKTGVKSTDILNNVYDLYGNSLEWTLQSISAGSRTYRGGIYNSWSYSPSYTNALGPRSNVDYIGSRLALYVV